MTPDALDSLPILSLTPAEAARLFSNHFSESSECTYWITLSHLLFWNKSQSLNDEHGFSLRPTAGPQYAEANPPTHTRGERGRCGSPRKPAMLLPEENGGLFHMGRMNLHSLREE